MAAKVIRHKALAGDRPCISFTIYTMPNDNPYVCGYAIYAGPGYGGQREFWQTGFGVPAIAAFRQSRTYANANGVPFIFVFDPEDLFFMINSEDISFMLDSDDPLLDEPVPDARFRRAS